MASGKKNKIAGILVGVLVLAGIGGYFAKNYYEEKMVRDIQAAMAAIPAPYFLQADSVTVSALSRSANFTGLRGGIQSPEGDMVTTIEQAEVNGLNLNAFGKGQGTVRLASSMVLRNLATKGPGVSGTVARYELADINGDFALIYEEWAKAYPVLMEFNKAAASGDAVAVKQAEEQMKVLAPLFKAIETLSVGKLAMQGYAVTMPFQGRSLSAALDSAEMKDYSLRRPGPMRMLGLAASLDGNKLFSLKEVSMDGAELPSYARIFSSLDALSGQDGGKVVLADPIAIKKLRFSELQVPAGKLPLTLAAADFSIDLRDGGESAAIAFKIDALDMKKSDLLAVAPKLMVVQGSLPEQLSFGTGLDCTVKKKEGGASDVSFKTINLSGKDMGEFAMSGDVSGVRSQGLGSPLIHKAAFSLTDNGIIDMAFALHAESESAGASQAPRDIKAMRQQIAAMVEAQRAAMPDPSLQKLNADITALLQQPGGTLRMGIAPANPVAANSAQMVILTNPASLGITSSFTPGK